MLTGEIRNKVDKIWTDIWAGGIINPINYIVQNGYIENISELTKPPFDKPQSFIKLFDGSKQKQIVEAVTKIKDNAVKIVG